MPSLMAPGTAVYIGANRGQFALAVRHVSPHVRIDSFEPLPVPAAILGRVFVADAGVRPHEMAIGPATGGAEIHLSARDKSLRNSRDVGPGFHGKPAADFTACRSSS